MSKRVLVIDDDCLLLKTIQICLSRRGHDVKAFHRGVDAVKCLFQEKLDLMVLDLRLPDCDGWFLAKVLQEIGSGERVPLIVISVLEPDRKKVAEFRPYAYIQKPFDMGHLMQVIDRSLSTDSGTVEMTPASDSG